MSISTDAFTPYRGTSESISNAPIQNGNVYFSTDDDKIYFDVGNVRHVMSGQGINFIYGYENTPAQDPETQLYLINRSNIDGAGIKINDIILNADGGFYKVVELNGDTVLCTLMMVSGSGGGTTTRFLKITKVVDFPTTSALGRPISATFIVTSSVDDTDAVLRITAESDSSLTDYVQDYDCVIGQPITVTIPANKIYEGANIVYAQAIIDESISAKAKKTVNCVSIKLEADQNWNPLRKFGPNDNTIDFSYRLPGVPVDGSIKVTMQYYIDTVLALSVKNIIMDSGSQNLTTQFISAAHGDHVLKIVASALIGSSNIEIGTLSYDIMWITNDSAPLIISPYANSQEINYSIISIPYMVFDPATEDGTAEVHYYVNDEEINTGARTITYSNAGYEEWQIKNYVVGDNVFMIRCGNTTKVFEIEVVRDSSRNLDPIAANSLLALSSFGRSNDESNLQRSSWTNNGYTAIFEGFNWYNNGWMQDSENNTALRISNGAKVRIPLNVLNIAAATNLTFEIDFKVRNAINFSKLISYVEVPIENPDPLSDVTTVVVKNVSVDEGVFGSYYNNNIGLCLGTQEAFFRSSSQLVNVRYTDNERVKISVVINSSDKLIYIYINGVLSGITQFDTSESFASNAAEFVFNSDYCDVDLYTLRVYNGALDYIDIIQNWIGDSSDLDTKLARYEENNLYTRYEDTNGVQRATISYEKALASKSIPVMVIKTYGQDTTNSADSDMLPYAKGKKKVVGIRYYDPADDNREVKKSFKCQNVQLDVQGTSSQGYPRRNFKLKTKLMDGTISGVLPFKMETWDGREVTKNVWSDTVQFTKYDLGNGTPETTFCLKADYMESSSSHNTGLANYVDILSKKMTDTYDFRHPLVRQNVQTVSRTTIYGFPILLFHENAAGVITFVGKYNFNIDKGATDSFGFTNSSNQPYMSSTVAQPETKRWAVRVDELSLGSNDDPYYSQWPVELTTMYQNSTTYSSDGKTILKPIKFKSNLGLEIFPAAVNQVEGLYEFQYNGLTWDLSRKNDPTDTVLVPVATGITKAQLTSVYGITFEVYVDASLSTSSKFWFVVTPECTLAISRGLTKTYAQTAECWELVNNQSGGRATFQKVDFEQTIDGTDGTKLQLITDFEARYHPADFDVDEIYESYGTDVAGANQEILSYMGNFKNLCLWINSTDVSNPLRDQTVLLPAVKYYKTMDTVYDDTHSYYLTMTDTVPTTIVETDSVVADTGVTVDTQSFVAGLSSFYAQEVLNKKLLVGLYVFSYKDNSWVLNDSPVVLADFGITLQAGFTGTIFSIRYDITNSWSANLYERFTQDSDRYRLCKFRNELSNHLNLQYCLLYASLTELLLMYDSRAKNLMLASWGPEAQGGEYIWYPIFYDMDTQLGINNSGVVFWDYDTDATPANGQSIFSGQASVLWNNLYACFAEPLKQCYRTLRIYGLSLPDLKLWYDQKQTDRWSEIVKNIDAFYKYIAPSLATFGYIDTSGNTQYSSQWFYCLQGDRKLNRDLFFRNRLNYIDSQWLGGTYYAGSQMGANIQMRYDANAENTSDHQNTNPDFDSNATFRITPYLSQYCTVFFDEKPVEPVVKFNVATDQEYVEIQPPEDLATKIANGVVLTQQLVYIYGPEYISDLGDLSLKYLDEFWSAAATRLKRLQLGNDLPGYKNNNLESDQLKLECGAENLNAKTLLSYLDLSNLAKLTKGLDVSGCIKLETLKALGTNLPNITLPKGNVIKTLYLPNTIKTIQLIEPQSLTKVITDVAQTARGIVAEGLFISGLTDKLDTLVTSNDTTIIDTFDIENTLLKYDTYKMLYRLYKIKKAMIAQGLALDTNIYSKFLKISAQEVDWTPYHKLEDDAIYNANTTYYYLKDNMVYSTYTYTNETIWKENLINLGIYTKEANPSIITSLDMIQEFIQNKLNTGITYQDFYFRSTYEDGRTKILPALSGNIHIENTLETALEEAELLNYYGLHYPNLIITANYVTEANRAKFVEVKDGVTITHYAQKVAIGAQAPTVSYTGIIPSRLHYDFLGWSKPDRTDAIKANGSIGTESDVQDLSLLTLDQNYEFCAVFRIHAYTVFFYNEDETLIGTTLVNSGNTIVPPLIIPYKNDSNLALTQCYKFIGYGYNGELDVIDLTSVVVYKEGLAFYAKYREESVYATPLTIDDLTYVPVAGGVSVGLKKQVSGKICIPKQITYVVEGQSISANVLEIMAGNNVGTNSANGLCNNINLTHVFFEGTPNNTANIQMFNMYAFKKCANLVHIDIPSSLLVLGVQALNSCPKLSISSLPRVQNIGANCFTSSAQEGSTNTLVIGGDIQVIASGAFTQVGWRKIIIGSSVNPTSMIKANFGDNATQPVFGNRSIIPYLEELEIYSSVFSPVEDLGGLFRDPVPTVTIFTI